MAGVLNIIREKIKTTNVPTSRLTDYILCLNTSLFLSAIQWPKSTRTRRASTAVFAAVSPTATLLLQLLTLSIARRMQSN